MKVELAKQSETTTLKDMISGADMQAALAKVLPDALPPDKFARICINAINDNPTLQQCTPRSFAGSMLTAASLALEPNTPLGLAYLIPYNNKRKGKMECTFQIGYKGLIALARRTGQYTVIDAREVHANDVFDYSYGMQMQLHHKPKLADRGEVVAYYAIYKTKNGGCGMEVMSKDEVYAHAKKYSQSFNDKNGPWQKEFDEMAKKTVLKRVLKYAPLSANMEKALQNDNQMMTLEADAHFVEDESASFTPLPGDEILTTSDGLSVDAETGEVLMDGMTSAEADALLAQEE